MDLQSAINAPRRPAFRWLGAACGFLGLVGGCVFVAATSNVWPSPTNTSLAVAGAIFVWCVAALVWLVVLGFGLVQRRAWSWSYLCFPIVLLAAVGVSRATEPSFGDAKEEFTAVAVELSSAPGRTYVSDVRIGRFDVKYAYDNGSGQVFFHDARRGLFGANPGWVYAPGGVDVGTQVRLGLTEIGNGWFRFDDLVVDD